MMTASRRGTQQGLSDQPANRSQPMFVERLVRPGEAQAAANCQQIQCLPVGLAECRGRVGTGWRP